MKWYKKFSYQTLSMLFLVVPLASMNRLISSEVDMREWDLPTYNNINDFSFAEFHLVEITKENLSIIVDMMYTTARNCTGRPISAETQCLVTRKIMDKLNKVQADLQQQGLGLKIFDGFRPLYVEVALMRYAQNYKSTFSFEQFCKEARLIPQDAQSFDNLWGYKMPPRRRSPLVLPLSNRGAQVAVTLVTQDGKELAMPTDFDDRSEQAASDFQALPEEVIANRMLLKNIMANHGFKQADVWYEFHDERAEREAPRNIFEKTDEYPRYRYSKYKTALVLNEEQKADYTNLNVAITMIRRGYDKKGLLKNIFIH